jgi:hypothetical protein
MIFFTAINFITKKQAVIFFGSYRVFTGFGQGKFAYGGTVLGSIQFTLLPQLPLK